jgi:hypothetical protein
MIRVLVIFLFFSASQLVYSQSAIKQFCKLSRPEKCWVLTRPFKAKAAAHITKNVLGVVDSIKSTGTIGNDMNGGKLDAFRHAYWMISLTAVIGKKASLKLGKAHEKGNYIEFRRRKLEDNILPDSVSCLMDLNNNLAGATAYDNDTLSAPEIQQKILDLLKEGKLYIIKKDKDGNYLYCDGTFIDTNVWKGKWNIPKCLITSDKT